MPRIAQVPRSVQMPKRAPRMRFSLSLSLLTRFEAMELTLVLSKMSARTNVGYFMSSIGCARRPAREARRVSGRRAQASLGGGAPLAETFLAFDGGRCLPKMETFLLQ